jgi:hypothetical protein
MQRHVQFLRRFFRISPNLLNYLSLKPIVRMENIQRYSECHFVGKTLWMKDHFFCPNCEQPINLNGGDYES